MGYILQIMSENKLGSDCSGSDGATNRVLTLSNTYLTIIQGFGISVGGFVQSYGDDYTVLHNSTGSHVTFIGRIHNSSPIEVLYFQEVSDADLATLYGFEPYTENLHGSDCTGSTGDRNRVLTLNNTKLTSGDGFMVFMGGFSQAPTEDYTVSHIDIGTTVTFLNTVYNESPIEVLYFQTTTSTVIAELAGRIRMFKKILNRHGQNATLKKLDTTRDTMGGIKAYTESDYTIRWLQQPITERDRTLVDMGLAVAGDMKAFFYPYYTSYDTGISGPNIKVEVGDEIIDAYGVTWIVEKKLGGRIADGMEVFSPCIVKREDLTR